MNRSTRLGSAGSWCLPRRSALVAQFRLRVETSHYRVLAGVAEVVRSFARIDTLT